MGSVVDVIVFWSLLSESLSFLGGVKMDFVSLVSIRWSSKYFNEPRISVEI